MAYAPVLGTGVFGHGGSTPPGATSIGGFMDMLLRVLGFVLFFSSLSCLVGLIFYCPDCRCLHSLGKFRRVLARPGRIPRRLSVCMFCLVRDRLSGENKYIRSDGGN